MKKIVLILVALSSLPAHAAKYICEGLDNHKSLSIELSKDFKFVGTVAGSKVQMSDNDEYLSFTIVQGKVVSVFVAKSGNFFFQQNYEDEKMFVSCQKTG